MPWIPRGVREGIVTSRYPARDDGYNADFRGVVVVRDGHDDRVALELAVSACPTRAITVVERQVRLDRGACVLCGRCTTMLPQVFEFSPSFESSTQERQALVVPKYEESDETLMVARKELASRVRVLRHSVHVRHVDAGSDGADEWEVAALMNPVYDVQRLGIFFTASPRHADVLLVTGTGAAGMVGPLQHTLDAMPHPKVVIAAGVDAISGGLLGEGYSSTGGIGSSVKIDVFIPGSPATPFGLLHGLLVAVNLLTTRQRSRTVEEAARTDGKSRGTSS